MSVDQARSTSGTTSRRRWAEPLALAWPDTAARVRARRWLLAVCLGVVVLHVLVVGLDRPINWDEAIHVTQVNPARPAVFMEPHRTRGLSLLVAPIVVFDPSMVVMRAALALAIGAGTFAAYAVWIPLIGGAAPLAAAVQASYWVTVFYSVEVLPNQPAALLAVAVTGLVLRRLAGALGTGPPGRAGRPGAPTSGAAAADGSSPPTAWRRFGPGRSPRSWWALVGTMLVFAMVRPPDAVLIGVGLAVLALVALRRVGPSLDVVAPAALGGAAGLLPWFAEGWLRFGFGPLTTVRSAGEYSVGAAEVNLLPLYLRSLETRLRCAGACLADAAEDAAAGQLWQLPPARTTLFLLGAGVAGLVALAVSRERWWLAAGPVVATVPLLWFTGVAGGAMNLRYLLPAYALLLLTPAMGVRVGTTAALAWLPRPVAWGAIGLVSVVIAVAGVWSIGAAVERFERPSTRDRAAELGQWLAEHAEQPCVVAARVNYPQIQFWSGCLATTAGRAQDGELQPPLGELGSYVDLAAAAEAGATVFAVDRAELADGSPLWTWERLDPDRDPVDGYVLYRHVPGAPLPPPPCPPDDGPERILGGLLSDTC